MAFAPIAANRIGDLRLLLATMNHSHGVVNPRDELVPLGQFERLYFARNDPIISPNRNLSSTSISTAPRSMGTFAHASLA